MLPSPLVKKCQSSDLHPPGTWHQLSATVFLQVLHQVEDALYMRTIFGLSCGRTRSISWSIFLTENDQNIAKGRRKKKNEKGPKERIQSWPISWPLTHAHEPIFSFFLPRTVGLIRSYQWRWQQSTSLLVLSPPPLTLESLVDSTWGRDRWRT